MPRRLSLTHLCPLCLLAAASLSAGTACHAQGKIVVSDIQACMVAGDPNGTPPDSPTGRVDPNVPTSPFAGVGFVDAIGSGGTGVAIDATHVLTAGHVIANGSATAAQPIKFYVNNGPTPTIITATAVVDPDFHGVNGNDGDDLAVLTLSSPLPAGTPTYSLDTQALAAGQTLTFVGYGVSGDGDDGYQPNLYPQTDTIKRVGGNDADAAAVLDGANFDAVAPFAGEQTYLYDFDGPDATTNIFGDPTDKSNLTLGNTIETTIGEGNSGSPAFILVNGHYEVAAINNFTFDLNSPQDDTHPAAGFFGSGGGGAVVSAYTGFIYSADPALAPEPGPLTGFCLGGLLLGVSVWRSRRRAGTSS